ncbi:transmembrane protein, distant homology with ydbS [Candidatus Syntrophocurvum alkaliphilum]|uniref:Transmembrane protein, distant homology with ydbS n=1 Tax=Candidatus Syntrophocurvum alkaliphilum TaxID=2293317 RepID=A0A6I6DNF6_9FIRM|nr:PH domain-containing protein [Candidatus Syntrophocurvum alkaliphilum]QGU00498.1 transmembrane protein, distant homology with ydbS [Candidatus Syntrophocurvum alkaliphilum]
MRLKPSQPLAEKTLNVWMITAFLQWILVWLVPVGYLWAAQRFDWPFWVLYVIFALIIVLGIIAIFVLPRLQWQRWRYEVYDNEVELMYGVIIVTRTIIPMIRVQHVDTKQGPLLRRYCLSSVTISTAATVHVIPGLNEEKADHLRDHIAKLAREADPDE